MCHLGDQMVAENGMRRCSDGFELGCGAGNVRAGLL